MYTLACIITAFLRILDRMERIHAVCPFPTFYSFHFFLVIGSHTLDQLVPNYVALAGLKISIVLYQPSEC